MSPESFSLLLLRNTFWSRGTGQGHGETASLIKSFKEEFPENTSSVQVYKYAVHKMEHDLDSFDETYTSIASQFLGAVNTQLKPLVS